MFIELHMPKGVLIADTDKDFTQFDGVNLAGSGLNEEKWDLVRSEFKPSIEVRLQELEKRVQVLEQ